ncbi:PaaI family thioesterase [Sediminitomix flava]|uniref:Acyl-coenzyme A thioesterase PaaI-like protein n=1 Tax=Sediminitomix flava TaxID=379075 RepID=A0A315Z9B4_SEDFL|nr:thioesterase [Sediminitomix flava]PWJ41862.1 hypothetical protein BC781_103112 [Sediminitomix flava]
MNSKTTTTSATFTKKQQKFLSTFTSPIKYFLFLLTQVPMGLVCGMKVREVTLTACTTYLPFRWINKNPFASIYFAVQSMAAELSTAALGVLALYEAEESIAFILVDMKAEFHKKAVKGITFTCEMGEEIRETVKKASLSTEAQTITAKTVGKMADGTIVSEFYFTWSFKKRSKS